jgi:hypothetical protein
MGCRALLAACLFWSCTPTAPPEGSDYRNLVGRWIARNDSSIVLTFTGACCGSKPRLEGSLGHGEVRVALDPPSYANAYPIQLPDSAGSREYAFEIALTVPLDPICAADGFVEDRSGGRAFSQPVLPDSAVLALTFSSRTARGCDSLWMPLLFERKP